MSKSILKLILHRFGLTQYLLNALRRLLNLCFYLNGNLTVSVDQIVISCHAFSPHKERVAPAFNGLVDLFHDLNLFERVTKPSLHIVRSGEVQRIQKLV